MKKKTPKLLSILLCCVMLIGLLPTTAFAWTAPTLSGNGGGTWNIQLSDEGVLSWNNQQSATSYTIEVDKTAMGSTLTKIENINGTSYNLINRFKELKIENGTYYFQIKANGPDTTSNTISFKYVSPQDKLSAPLNLRWDGTTAKWDSVANATGYTVILYTSSGSVQLNKTTTETQYDWTTEAADGRWFEVVATADNYRDSNPAEGPRYGNYSWTAPTLTGGKAEWNVTLSDDGMLRWNDMSSATYDIEVDKTAMGGTVTNIYSINTNTYNLINRFKTLKLENGTYYFTIKANDSDTNSGTISFKYISPQEKLSVPQNLRWDGTVAKWDSVANATGYTVILYTSSGSVQLNKTTTETQYNWDTEAADGRWFEVIATAADYRDSNAAESPKYVVVSYSIGAYPYDATVDATQAGGQVYLTTDAGTDGWSSDGYIKKATEGTTVTLNANPAAGYQFVEWRQGTSGATISTDANYQFNASENKYLYAVFETVSSTTYDIELDIFDITYTATDGGTVSIQANQGSSVSGSGVIGRANENTAVTITAVPKQGYEFVAWKKWTPHNATAFSADATYTFTATEEIVDVNENPELFLYAVFQETQPQATTYLINCVSHNLSSNETGGTVMLETDKGGTGYAASQQKYATENTTVRLRAVAEPGYQFVAWRKGSPTDANATVSTSAEYEFTATEAVWMYAVFEYTPDCTVECVPFDITGGINNGQNNVGGTVSIQTDKGTASGTITQSLKATRNSSVTVNAVAASGYEFLGWKKASPYVQNFVATTASYTFDINEELYLYAVFQKIPPVVGGFIDFLTTDNNVCFAETDESGFMRVNLFGNGKAMKLPLVYRTDNLDLKFDGWYTAKVGGEKVTEDTVFNGYTILYDRWTAANIDNAKIITAIEIPNSALVNGYTEIEYINASSAVNMDGVVNSKVYAVYNGLNAYGSQVTGAETIDTSNDYSVVTSVKLEDGYYFAPNISLTAQHGVRAGVTYRAIVDGVGVTTNTWNNLATTVDICINFPAGGNNVGFTTEPQSGVVEAGQQYNFTWAVSGQPTAAELQMKNGSEWAKADDLNINQTSGTISAQTGTKTYRILVTYGNSGSIYCNEFTVTWLAAVQNTFSMSPASGTVKNGTDYYYTWACVQTPATANLERKNGNSWDDLGTATSRKITYDNNYADTTQTFRIKATMVGGSAFYSDEFTVTYKATPLFSVQPGNGKVAVGSTYTVNYTVQTSAGDGEFDGNNSVLQKKNGVNWENVSTSVYATETVVPAQNSATTETYRVGIKIGSNELLYSESFTVQWIDDYTFELDQNSLAWGSIAKSDYYGEYAKIIKVMPTGTKTYTDDTLKYDTPNNFDVSKWKSPSGYYLLTFTPKASLDAGDYNEDINIWVTSNGSDELEKKTVNLSITVVDETPTYTISFNPGEGTGSMASVPNTTGTYELPACTFTAPANKEFKAWQVNDGEEKNPGETIPVTGNTVLTALWKDLPVVSGYTITFEAGGGSGTMAPVAGASGNYHLPSCTFTAPANKQFKAWQVNGQGEYQPGAVITVTSNTTVTAIWRDIPTEYWTVKVNGLYICGAAYNHSIEQKVEKGQPMSTIIVTANDGYYFADPLQVSGAENGITVTRVSYTQVTVSGTPTADVYNIGFSASSKQKESAPTNLYFEATGADTGNLCNLENGVTYAVSGAATAEFTATDSTYALTNVTEGTLNVVKKASDPNTKLDSDAHDYTVGKHATIPNVTSFNCTDANNNNGQLWNVSIEMEYQKEGDNGWTPGTGSNITGLTPGTYYVRYKASNINLAGNPKTITIAAYNVPALTGTVTITGDAKFGEQLTADVSGITNNTGTLSYQWKRGNTDIGTNSATYTIVEADIGSTIKVVVTSSVESGSITSNATTTVEKADGPAAPTGLAGVAPTFDGGSDGKITGTATTMEYSTDSSFTNPTGTVCPDTETTGLTAGTYYVRYKETATHKAGANATVTVPAYVAAPVYSISLDATGTQTFTAATVGYAAQTAKTVTVSNTGNNATGALTVALSGNNASSFTLSKTSIADIAVSGNDTFTVVPNTGLAAGTYTATVTVSGGNSITASFDVSFTVNPAAPTYSIALSPSGTQTFTAATVGYGAQSAKTITVNNTGTGATGALTVALSGNNASSFTLSKTSIADIAVSGNDTFTVVPNTGLAAGTYTATVTVSGGNSITASFNVSFTVNSAGGGGNGGGGGGGSVSTYAITVEDAKNGDVAVSPKSASKDTTVTVTVDPDKGYTLETLTVADKNGKEIELTNKGDGKYTFKMPASKVTVKATFMEDNTMLNYFVDVFATDYYYDAVLWAVEEGITNGTSATTFSPGADCTRAQMATFLWRAAGSPEPVGTTNPFADIAADAYYAKAVQWAYEQGITGGTSATTFSPDAACTRAQMVTFLHRVAEGKPVSDTVVFADIKADKYYAKSVQWAYEQKITVGTSATTFSPDDPCTRAQMVTFLYRYFVK